MISGSSFIHHPASDIESYIAAKGKTYKINAGYVIADSGNIYENASIIINQGGYIAAVGPAERLAKMRVSRTYNMPNHAICPGFVNAHCHLELSFLKGKLAPGEPFTHWIKSLVKKRMRTSPRTVVAGIKRGIHRLIETGTTCVGDISATGLVTRRLIESGLRAIVFHETIGYQPEVAGKKLKELVDRVEGAQRSSLVTHGVSPHAVYTVSPELMKKVAAYARGEGRRLAIHLCETPEESRFARRGDGVFREFLNNFGVSTADYPATSPVNAVMRTGALEGALAIHMNCATPRDIAALKRAHGKAVICPNSNRWFGRKTQHPLLKMMDIDIPCGIGTDSLASNDDLCMAEEIATLAETFPELPSTRLFQLATEGGAKALGFPEGYGTLRPGAPFDAVAILIKSPLNHDPLWDIMNPRRMVHKVWIAGILRYRDKETAR